MNEILPGVWHWTAEHPNIHHRVSSYYLEDAAVALDPMLPEEGGLDAFGDWRIEQVILTCRHHLRDAVAVAGRDGARIRVPRNGLYEFDSSEIQVEAYDPGDEIAPGVRVHRLEAISPDDEVLHVHAGLGALAFADGLVHYRGRIGFVADGLMDDPPTVKARTFERLRKLVELDFDALLFAHGEPLPSGGRDALRDFMAAQESA